MAVEQPASSAAALEEEAEAEQTSDDEAAEGEAEEESSGSDASGEAGDPLDSTAKKRKKKKKKKKAGGGGGAAAAAQTAVDPAARKEGERRLQEAVDHLSHNSDDGMWVRLGGCHLADGKLKKICEALRSNTTCISIDLSANHFSDEGALALAAALADGRAPDLIDLDLRDNPQILQSGTAALAELQQQRKTLRVALGASAPPPPPQQQQGAAAGGQQSQQQQQQEGHANGGGSSLAESVKANPVISKYFTVGNDDAEEAEQQQIQQQGQQPGAAAAAAAGTEGQEQLGGLSAAELARILWDQLEQCLDAPRPHIPAVSEPLRAIAEQVEHEMDNCALPMMANTEISELKTFSQWAIRKLRLLHSVLDLVPPPILTPYSKTTPVPAVGTHRAAVAELLAQLLRGECASIAREVAASGLLRRCAAVAFAHPNCSAIHGAVGRCLKLSLGSHIGHVGLWRQLLGAPLDAAAPGAAVAAPEVHVAEEAAAIGAAAKAAPSVGKRPPNVGFALAVAQMLHVAATGEVLGANSQAAPAAAEGAATQEGQGAEAGAAGGGSPSGTQQQQQQQGSAAADSPQAGPSPPQASSSQPSPAAGESAAGGGGVSGQAAGGPERSDWQVQLAAQLQASPAWAQFSSGPDCLLRQLLGEHVGDLGGPRPTAQPPPPPPGEGEEEEAGGVSSGQVISGQELLMMLRGLNLGGFHGGI
ncbi:hypothetical protein D9Q98_009870 [Chlorella vulgaris]|uniref:Uncharacterized protein n=1 Tax=Chlorella vulgaris TaxID=3077 RepID=A0A9D4TFJ9_CHLVU|nr:hypothetical protein D9Q98_009870 [Chlorella vulgaris]